MSSIEKSPEDLAREFFDRVLAPLGADLQSRGAVTADVAPQRAEESFYSPSPPLARADFESPSGGDPEALRAALRARWKDDPALAHLADQLADLAASLGAEIDQDAEISPSLYVMF
jgi:hypothetical protein